MIKTSTMSALALAAVLAACGKNDPPAPAAPVTPPAPAASPVTPPAPAAPAPSAPETKWPAPTAPTVEAPTTVTPSAPVAAASGDTALGSSIYNKVCALCHAAGVGGAPKPGDKADWGPRIGQGKDVLYKHALEGFTGQKGMMPPRGGSPALKDEEVKAAVDFMVSKSE